MSIHAWKRGMIVRKGPPTPISRPTTARKLTFLDLPPAIRNQIYEYCILDSELEIVSRARTSAKPFGDVASLPRPEARPHGTSFAEYWQQIPIDESPFQHSSWKIEPMELYRKFVVNDTGNSDIGPTMSSKRPRGRFRAFEASYAKGGQVQSLVINLFLVNKQICPEASISAHQRTWRILSIL
ncbi:hypothetical protein DPSP01_004284 [Paraphaeosphaeria sporulosa]